MILDPRYSGLNDLLRRPLRQAHWGAGSLALTLQVDGEPLAPAEGHWRPSHNSLYGSAAFSGLQVVQDSFTAQDGTEVLSLLLRNPSAETVFVELVPHWSRKNGASEQGWVHRCTPPLDDLLLHLPADAVVARNFALTQAPTEDTAFKLATRWFFEPSPVAVQTERFEHWCSENTFLFDASDPWLTRLVAHCQALRWRGLTPPPRTNQTVQDGFLSGDFDTPRDDCPAWDRWVEQELLGLRLSDGHLALTPSNALGLTHFCVQGRHNTTIVWDDPTAPHDAYDDQDKGLTVYVGRVRAYNQPTLAPCRVPLTPSPRPF